MAKAPAFQFYVKDWISSKRVRMMSRADRGSFIDMLAYCWDSDDCALTDDEMAFASGLGDRWQAEGTKLREMFIPHPTIAGKFTNERLLAERNKQVAWKQKCAKGGKRAAKSKAAKRRSGAAESEVKGTKDLVDVYHEVKPYIASSSSFSSSSSSSSSSSPSGEDPPLPPQGESPPAKCARPKKSKPDIPILEIISLAESLDIPVHLAEDGSVPPELAEVVTKVWNSKAERRHLDWWRDVLFGRALQSDWLVNQCDSFSLGWICRPKIINRVLLFDYGKGRKASTGPPGKPTVSSKVMEWLEQEEARDAQKGSKIVGGS